MIASIGRTKIMCVYALLLVPPTLFYFLLFRSLSIFPFFDDYNSVLEFLLRWKRESGLQHIQEIVSFQHNEYRLMFESAIFGAQYGLFGHTNLKALSILGDLFVVAISLVVYLIWRRGTLPKSMGLISLFPISWLLFQLQYAETLNWSMASLSNLPALLFAFLAIYLATAEGSTWTFPASLVCMGLSSASSGNGLVLIPLGGIMMLQRKEYRRFWMWLLTGAFVCVIYFYKYDFASSRTHSDHNVLSSAKHISLPYAASFLGAAAAARNALPAVIVGTILIGVFFLATREKIYARNPALYYSVLFLILAAIGVSGLRSDNGLATSLASRYRINSALMLILVYLYLAEKLENTSLTRGTYRAAVALCGVALVTFTLVSDRVGYQSLLARRTKLDSAMEKWERVGSSNPQFVRAKVPNVKDDSYYFDPVEPTLTEAISAGIYLKPKPQDR